MPKRFVVEFAIVTLDRNLQHAVAEFLEAGPHFGRVGKVVEARAPRIGHELASNDARVGIVDGQHLQAQLFCQIHDRRLGPLGKGRARGEGRALVVLQIRVTPPVGFLFQNQEITMLQKVSRG